MTITQIQDDIVGLCQELAGEFDFTLDRIMHLINRGYYDFVRRTNCIEDRIDITSVANQVSYSVADAANIAFIYRINEIRHIESGVTENGFSLKSYPGGYVALPEKLIYSSSPTHYWTRAMQSHETTVNVAKVIGTWPVLNSSNDTLRIHCYRFPLAELTVNTSTMEIDPAYQDAITFYVAWRVHMMYQHKNPFIQQKSNDMQRAYFDLVKDFNLNASMEVNDFGEIINVY